MKSKYLVTESANTDSTNEIAIINASNPEEAMSIYFQKCILPEKHFQEYVLSKIPGESFCNKFFRASGVWQDENESEDDITPYKALLEDRASFEAAARSFFTKNPQYAEIFIAEFFKNKKSKRMDPAFPIEMLQYIYYSDAMKYLCVIDLATAKEIT